MAKKSGTITYNYACFHILAYEYGDNKIKDSEKKIKAKLKYNGLGVYDEQRVNKLRTLKEELAAEFRLYKNSKYFLGTHGEYSNIEDFDYKKMAEDFFKKYSFIGQKELGSIVMFSINLFHLR